MYGSEETLNQIKKNIVPAKNAGALKEEKNGRSSQCVCQKQFSRWD
jgi:hypothetical protein